MTPAELKARLDGSSGSQSIFEKAALDYIMELEAKVAQQPSQDGLPPLPDDEELEQRIYEQCRGFIPKAACDAMRNLMRERDAMWQAKVDALSSAAQGDRP